MVISAGATLPPTVAAQFRRTYGQPIHTFYGSSECGGICYDRVGDAAERGSVGTPVEGVELSFMPHEGATDGVGLVTVRSAAVCDTYLPPSDRPPMAGRFETADLAGPGARVLVDNSVFGLHLGRTGRTECAMFAGSLAGCLEWAAGDAGLSVKMTARETHCIAQGDAQCLFEVQRA